MASRIYSVGYEGWTLRGFLESLTQNRVQLVVDVRLSPVSRRRGFSKRQLEEALAKAGIKYMHEPKLGNPVTNRARFRSAETLAGGRRAMRRRLENGSRAAVTSLIEQARRQRVAVVCVERAAPLCHRSVITDVISEIEPDIEIVNVL